MNGFTNNTLLQKMFATEKNGSYGHLILRESASLIAADNGGASQGLDSLEILHQAILTGHLLGGQGQADRHRGDNALRHVGHDNTDQKHHRVDPVVAHHYGHNEERNAQEDGPTRD